MFENFENKQEGERSENQKVEAAVNFTGKGIEDFFDKENGLNIVKFKTKIASFLIGLFLAFGAMGSTAQAQDWRRLATRGVESILVNSERDKSQQYLEEFQREEARINFLGDELNNRFRKESDELWKKKNEVGLQKLSEEYRIEKINLDLAREKNLQDYKEKMEKQRIRRQATDLLRDAIR